MQVGRFQILAQGDFARRDVVQRRADDGFVLRQDLCGARAAAGTRRWPKPQQRGGFSLTPAFSA